MLFTPEQAAAQMTAEHPRIAETLGRLCELAVGYALIGSRAAQHAELQSGHNMLPAPDDWDIQVVPDRFWDAVDVTGATVQHNKQVRMTTGDGLLMHYTADEALAVIGSDTLQFLRIHTGMVYVNGKPFQTGLTPGAYLAATHCDRLVVAHDVDAGTIYALRQAGAADGKHDFERAVALRRVRDPATDSYAHMRALEYGWDERLHNFDRQVVTVAMQDRHEPVLATA